jgi:hypothetical protein
MGETVFPGVKAQSAIRIGAYASLVNGDIITIGAKVYEFRTSGSATVGRVQVDVGVSGAATALALQAAIVANPPSPQIDAYIDPVDSLVVRLEGHDHGTPGNVIFSASMTGATNIIDQTSGFLVDGEAGSLKHVESGRKTVRQLEVTAGCIMIPTTIQSPKILSVQIFAADGSPKNDVTTKWTTSLNRLKGALAGGTDPIAGDIVAWSARD